MSKPSSLCLQLSQLLLTKDWMLCTAESCTGGLISAACTELAGSSVWFERGFVTYSNAAKTELLRVPEALIAAHGAVSEPVALSMASGAIAHSRAQVAVAVTGVAGPGGGTPAKPVGTVWLAWSVDGQLSAQCCHLEGDRNQVRQATVVHALQGLISRISNTFG